MTDNFYNQTNANGSDFFLRYNKADGGIIWFIVFLPLIGLFLENYAVSKFVGIFLWASIIILMPVCCYADCKKLGKIGYDTTFLKKWIFISPIYVFYRERITGRDVNKSIMLGIFLAGALFLNGFTQSIHINGDVITESLKNSPVSYLENYSGSSQNIIETQIDNYFDDSAEWTIQKQKYGYDIIVSGTHESEKITVTFKFKYDGYVSKGVSVADISVNGKTLSGDDFKAYMREIFIPETIEANSDSSDSSSDSSQTE